MQMLREGGFTDAEIDGMLSHLNETYAGLKKNEYIEKELQKMNEEILKRRGVGLTEKERADLRAGIETRLDKKR